ncbi:LDLR chaperone boca [Trichonephila inaurata madagascariensis]|uniref:LDLR chaperone boca n=1 Tax=Trichonephila inaurata madagascariensis TaxID=2747483 RepID=A0A8X6IAR8_9ARAC|nr:LDLR chaperone boca [Trichonephila inaurata madagascariensis]GFS66401.1 LDLR chaperone boca [Trichonephila inaurata madagascariensis]
MLSLRTVVLLCLLFISMKEVYSKKADKKKKPDWAKKDIRDYTDADLERLYDQWEEDDEPLEPDELPEHLRPAPKIDISNIAGSKPEDLLKMSKKGKTLMVFVTVSGNPTEKETEEITGLWQSSLMNNHINVDRYPIGGNRVIFMFKDGSQAWEAKDYLVDQKRCELVTIESKEYYGKHSSKKSKKEEL